MRTAEGLRVLQPLHEMPLLAEVCGVRQHRIEAGRRNAAHEGPVPAPIGKDRALGIPQPLLYTLAQLRDARRQAIGRRGVAAPTRELRQHLAVEGKQAVEADVEGIEAAALRIVLRLVMD